MDVTRVGGYKTIVLYHYSYRDRLLNILDKGLFPGAEVGLGERLPCILFDREEYKPTVGAQVYLKVELDADDPLLHPINKRWFEYYGVIPPERIVAVAIPPQSNDEMFALLLESGNEATRRAFEYVDVDCHLIKSLLLE